LSSPSRGSQAQNLSLPPSDTLIWINGTTVATSTGIGKCHDHRAKDGQEHVSDRIGHRNPEHRRLTVRSLAASGDRRIHRHRSREGATNDDRVKAQDAMRHDGRNRQRNQRDDQAQRKKQQAVGLNGRNRCWPVCKPDGGDEATEADVAQRLLR
jgi:hypothetical protein